MAEGYFDLAQLAKPGRRGIRSIALVELESGWWEVHGEGRCFLSCDSLELALSFCQGDPSVGDYDGDPRLDIAVWSVGMREHAPHLQQKGTGVSDERNSRIDTRRPNDPLVRGRAPADFWRRFARRKLEWLVPNRT